MRTLGGKAALSGVARAYGAVTGGIRFAYEANAMPVRRIEGARVISVGNLRMGGSGKTPMVAMIARLLRDEGHKVAVVLRGYRGRMESPGGMVSVGDGPIVSAREAGDEAFMLAGLLDRVPVAVGADRFSMAQTVVGLGATVVLLDDGFQHRGVFRDLDIVLACPEDLDPCTELFPAGPLREPAKCADRADLVVGLQQDWATRPDHPPVIVRHVPKELVLGESKERRPVSWLEGRKIHLLCAIGRPKRFLRTAYELGAVVTGTTFLGDHRVMTESIMDRARSSVRLEGAEMILMTGKDLARMNGVIPHGGFGVLEIDCEVVEGKEELARALELTR